MSYGMPFELVNKGVVVHTHEWRTWFDPKDADEYKGRCIEALNSWHEVQGAEVGGTIKRTIPTIPTFDSIRFEFPDGNIVTVQIRGKE